jgi:hypothetical protein
MTVIFVTPFPSLLNAEVENRHPSTLVGENPVNYDDATRTMTTSQLVDHRTDNDATNGNHLQSTGKTLTTISYSVKPSTVRYHSNPLYCATDDFSTKLPQSQIQKG